ncbi:68e5de3c-8b65-43e5-b94f-c58c3d966fdb [Sclerotinia trifoliorum]|uniref:68e5de3c-8b65-43e5-b94f-c58c3d966fdb n=1 Tax=Sclerotinia trifoliorum TaxID=28548 RepID=A0A8H2VPM6_9HELO|nr:68e5de3c-8b65-43e5-b94f-c58c3d966fdb [Sclerotinia trifoliorum]
MVAAVPTTSTPWRRQTNRRHATSHQSLPSPNIYPHDLLLTWQWEPASDEMPTDRVPEINCVVPGYLKTDADKATRSYDVIQILQEATNYERAMTQLEDDIEKYEEIFGRENLHILSCKDRLAPYGELNYDLYRRENLLFEVVKIRQHFQGNFHQDTLNSKAQLAMIYIKVKWNDGIYPIMEEDYDYSREITDAIRDNARIREVDLMRAIIHIHQGTRHPDYVGQRWLELFLSLKRENASITKNVIGFTAVYGCRSQLVSLLQASEPACENTYDSQNPLEEPYDEDVWMSLIEKRGAHMQVTKELLMFVGRLDVRYMWKLLEAVPADFEITSEVLEVVAGVIVIR